MRPCRSTADKRDELAPSHRFPGAQKGIVSARTGTLEGGRLRGVNVRFTPESGHSLSIIVASRRFLFGAPPNGKVDNKSFVNAFGFVPYDDRCAQINLPALASARLPASRCAFHKCHA